MRRPVFRPALMKHSRYTFIALGLLAAAFVSCAVIFGVARDKQAEGLMAGQLAKVAALGRIEPASEIVNLSAGMTPDRLDTLLVARGDAVKKGQTLGYLGGYPEQMTQRSVLESQFKEALLRRSTELTLNQKKVMSAEIRKRQVYEVSPLRIAAQQATISSLEAKLANDKDIFSSQTLLYDRGVQSRRLREDQQAIVAQGEANLAAARAQLSQIKQQFEVDKVDADVQIELARAQLERSEAEFPIASLEVQIAKADALAKRMMLVAPIDGRILNIKVKPGEDVGAGPILVMGDTGRMRAVAEVYETDIGKVSVGQTATVTSRALSRPVTGKVVRIGNMVFKNDVLNIDPAARADARVVEVWIELDDAGPTERLTNLTVDVLIDTVVTSPAVANSAR